MNAMLDWMRVDSKQGAPDCKRKDSAADCIWEVLNMCGGSKLLDSGYLLDKAMATEWQKLFNMMRLLKETRQDEAMVTQAEKDRLDLNSNKAGHLYKPLALFPTGMHINKKVGDALLTARVDKTHAAELVGLKATCDSLQAPTSEECIVHGRVVVPQSAVWKELRAKALMIEANSSKLFREKHAADLDFVARKQAEIFDAVFAASLQIFKAPMQALGARLLTLLSEGSQQVPADLDEMFAMVDGAVLTADEAGHLATLCSKEKLSTFEQRQDSLRAAVGNVRDTLGWLISLGSSSAERSPDLACAKGRTILKSLNTLDEICPGARAKEVLQKAVALYEKSAKSALIAGMASFKSFVAAFSDVSAAPEEVFTKALTGCIPSGIDAESSEGTDHLKHLLAVVAAVQSALLPRLADVGCTVELDGVPVPMEMLCAAPVHLVSGQHIAGFDAASGLQEKPVKEQMLTLRGCLGKILQPALLAILKAQSWTLEQDLMKDRAEKCTEHCVLRCEAFAGDIMDASSRLAARVMRELGDCLASEAMGAIVGLIQPDFPKGVQKKMLAALDIRTILVAPKPKFGGAQNLRKTVYQTGSSVFTETRPARSTPILPGTGILVKSCSRFNEGACFFNSAVFKV